MQVSSSVLPHNNPVLTYNHFQGLQRSSSQPWCLWPSLTGSDTAFLVLSVCLNSQAVRESLSLQQQQLC